MYSVFCLKNLFSQYNLHPSPEITPYIFHYFEIRSNFIRHPSVSLAVDKRDVLELYLFYYVYDNYYSVYTGMAKLSVQNDTFKSLQWFIFYFNTRKEYRRISNRLIS